MKILVEQKNWEEFFEGVGLHEEPIVHLVDALIRASYLEMFGRYIYITFGNVPRHSIIPLCSSVILVPNESVEVSYSLNLLIFLSFTSHNHTQRWIIEDFIFNRKALLSGEKRMKRAAHSNLTSLLLIKVPTSSVDIVIWRWTCVFGIYYFGGCGQHCACWHLAEALNGGDQ